jgi:hypothetical protein
MADLVHQAEIASRARITLVGGLADAFKMSGLLATDEPEKGCTPTFQFDASRSLSSSGTFCVEASRRRRLRVLNDR